MRITKSGIYHDVSEVDYHADPCPTPSLSSSIASILLRKSPMHAAAAHPKLLGHAEREESEALDLGTVAHAYLLSGMDKVYVIDAVHPKTGEVVTDYRTAAAQEQRDAARAIGNVPILAHKMEEVERMARAIRAQLDRFEEKPTPLRDGTPEVVMCWQEDTPSGSLWCRARVDWFNEQHCLLEDLKTTATSARHDDFIKHIYSRGMDVQAAFYMRAIKALINCVPRWRWVVCENSAPFAVSVLSLGPAALAHADDKCQQAINTFAKCLKEGRWPGYPTRTAWCDPPAWEVAQWLEQSEGEEDEA